jgi:single-strand DNA-binding protein
LKGYIIMSDVNSITVTGRLTKDSIYKDVSSGLCEFSIANNTGFGDHEKCTFFKCTLWGKRAISLSQYLVKGQLVGVVGVLTTNKWESQTDGTQHTDLCINVNDVTLLGGRKEKAPGEPVEYETPIYHNDVPF